MIIAAESSEGRRKTGRPRINAEELQKKNAINRYGRVGLKSPDEQHKQEMNGATGLQSNVPHGTE